LLATFLAAGVLVIWSELIVVVCECFRSKARSSVELELMSDGTPAFWVTDGSVTSLRYENLQGELLEGLDVIKMNHRLARHSLPIQPTPGNAGSWKTTEWSLRIVGLSDQASPPVFWYLIRDAWPNGSAYLVGYDSLSSQLVGYLGKAGCQMNLPTEADRFPLYMGNIQYKIPRSRETYFFGDDPKSQLLAGADRRLYQVDLVERRVRTVLDGASVESFGYLFPEEAPPANLLVRTDREVLLLDKQFQVQRRYSIPTELAKLDFEWSEIAPDSAVVSVWHGRDAETGGRQLELLYLNAAGEIAHRQAIVNPGNAIWANRYADQLASAPIVMGLFFGLRLDWSSALEILKRIPWIPFSLTVALSLVLTIACYRRERRYGPRIRERVLWPLFVLVFGLPGWIGYRFGRRWPVLEHCPSCGRVIPRADALCPCCQIEMPRPAPLGLEICAT
jgi:hypothetical protein